MLHDTIAYEPAERFPRDLSEKVAHDHYNISRNLQRVRTCKKAYRLCKFAPRDWFKNSPIDCACGTMLLMNAPRSQFAKMKSTQAHVSHELLWNYNTTHLIKCDISASQIIFGFPIFLAHYSQKLLLHPKTLNNISLKCN